MIEKVISQIEFEIGQIDQLLESYVELFERAKADIPNMVDITALGSVLHSFYNGLENIFLTIAKRIDQKVPKTTQWHRDLLNQMTKTESKRRQVLSTDMAHRLADYLGFRHFYRHSYSFFLDWHELEKLVNPLEEVWVPVKNELHVFLDSLKQP